MIFSRETDAREYAELLFLVSSGNGFRRCKRFWSWSSSRLWTVVTTATTLRLVTAMAVIRVITRVATVQMMAVITVITVVLVAVLVMLTAMVTMPVMVIIIVIQILLRRRAWKFRITRAAIRGWPI